jgi:hypothetical protein
MLKITGQTALNQNETAGNICAHMLSRLARFVRRMVLGGHVLW